jgi:hypothetical protein
MRITTKQLNKIIKEEIRNVLLEQQAPGATILDVSGGSDPVALERYLVRGEIALPDGTIVNTHSCPGHDSGANQFNGIGPVTGELRSSFVGGNVRLTFPSGLPDDTLSAIQDMIKTYAPRILRGAASVIIVQRGDSRSGIGRILGF